MPIMAIKTIILIVSIMPGLQMGFFVV